MQVDMLTSGRFSEPDLVPPWGALVRMKGFLVPEERRVTAEPVPKELVELENQIRNNACVAIMLHAIMGQQNSRSSIEVPQPRRDGLPLGSLIVRSAVGCDCCQFEFWNSMKPTDDRDQEVNNANGKGIATATHRLPRCDGSRLEDWDLEGVDTPHDDLPPCSHANVCREHYDFVRKYGYCKCHEAFLPVSDMLADSCRRIPVEKGSILAHKATVIANAARNSPCTSQETEDLRFCVMKKRSGLGVE